MDGSLPEVPNAEAAEVAASSSNRPGIALITALCGIVVLAMVIAGAFFSSTQEYRASRNDLVQQRAFAVAEYGLNSEISNWDRARNLPGGMAVGEIDSGQVYVASGDTARVKVTRLTDNAFWVVSEGKANIGNTALESRRQSGAYVRIAYPTITPKGAITAAGNVQIQGSAVVDGNNHDPVGWGQCTSLPGAGVPAVTVAPTNTVSYGPNNITSTPAVAYDPAASDSNTYVRYGSESWNTLSANADIKLTGTIFNSDIAPVGTATTCDASVITNWGEPNRPGAVVGCQGYFPIIYASGSLHLNGNGYGQGILLVNGDLEINGKFEFYGLVIVRDDLTKSNGTAKIQGAVFAANLSLSDPQSWLTGNQDVFYSKCAVESALQGSSILTFVRQRGWTQIY